jgi:hypothetical protein
MHHHGPKCLEGPVSGKQSWWLHPNENPLPMTSPSALEPPRGDQESVRGELVQRIRREIAAGTYETPEKIERALSRLLAHLQA